MRTVALEPLLRPRAPYLVLLAGTALLRGRGAALVEQFLASAGRWAPGTAAGAGAPWGTEASSLKPGKSKYEMRTVNVSFIPRNSKLKIGRL